jgi:3-phosphoshikimate 1-carboxyvinyltransferase
MGLTVDEYPDGFAFDSKNNLLHSTFNSYDDHRIAMAFGIAALALQGESTIHDAGCVSISFPTFWETIQVLQR